MKQHFYKHKGFWRCKVEAWEFAGTTWQMAYNNYLYWEKGRVQVNP